MTFIDGPHTGMHHSTGVAIRMGCRLTLWHYCARAYFNLVCCSVNLASCCSGRVLSQNLTSMRCSAQREGCTACMPLWWPFFVPTCSKQIASGLEQDLSSSAERFGRSHWGEVPSWLHVPARPDFVEPSVFHFQNLRKWCFLQNYLCSRF